MEKIETPEYATWFRNDALTREEAALLMVGVEPNSMWGKEIVNGYNGDAAKNLEKYYNKNAQIKKAYDTFFALYERLYRSMNAGDLAPYTKTCYCAVYIKIIPLLTVALKEIDACDSFKAALQTWVESHRPKTTKPKPTEKPLATKERETLMKMIIGMAIGGYGYDPTASKSSIPTDIYNDLALHGVQLDQDTIRNKLKAAAHFLSGTKDAVKPKSVIPKPKSAKTS